MTIAFVATRGGAVSTAAGTTFATDMATGGSITVGNTLVMGVAYRDAVTPPTDQHPYPGPLGLALDQRGNLWRRVAVSVNQGSSTAADNGAVAEIWVSHVTFPYSNGDDIVLQIPFASAVLTHISTTILEFSGVKRVSRPLDFDSAIGNGTAVSVPGIQPTLAGQLVYAFAAVASNPTLTGDGDATGGAWSAISQTSTAAGGITRGGQFKIVTSNVAQSWDITWTGTQQWAAAAVVLEEATNPWPFNNQHLANPGYPCPAGAEILPVDATQTPIDTGTAYVFDVTIPPESSDTSSVYWEADLNPIDPTADSQHAVIAEVYPRGQHLIRNTPVTINMGVPYAATLQGGATTTGGTAVAALAAPGGEQVILEVNQSVDCWWDFSDLASYVGHYRVLNLQVNYVAWKDDSAAAEPGEGLYVRWRDETAISNNAASRITSLHGAWLVNDYRPSAKRVYRDLGEINGLPRIGATSQIQYANVNASFTLNDLMRMNAGDQSTMLTIGGLSGSAPSQETVFLDTIELLVTLVPEKRLAQGARRVSTGVGFPDGLVSLGGRIAMPLFDAFDTNNFWRTPDTTAEMDVSVVLREPNPASPSDWFSAQTDPANIPLNFNGANFRYASQERVGPSTAVFSIVQPRATLEPQLVQSRVEFTDGQVASGAVPEEQGQYIHAFTLIDLNSLQSFWPQYDSLNLLEEGISLTSSGSTNIQVDGSSTYTHLKFLVKAPDAPGAPDLNISIEQPLSTVLATVTLTQAEVLAQPDVSNGFREIVAQLSTPITPSSATPVIVVLTSSAADNDPWVPGLGVDAGGRTSYVVNPASPTVDLDYALVLSCELADLDAEISTESISVPSSGTSCVGPTSTIPCITVNNATDYDWISITRVVEGLDIFPLALIDVNGELTYPELVEQDNFSRVNAVDWGNADLGGTWTYNNPTNFSVNGSAGVISTAINTTRVASLGGSYLDAEVSAKFDVAATPTGDLLQGILRLRCAAVGSTTTGYIAIVQFNTNGTLSFGLAKATGTVLFTFTPAFPDYVPGTGVYVKLGVHGDQVMMKRWLANQGEPDWQAVVTDTDFAAAGVATVQYSRPSGNTSPDPSMFIDEYTVTSYDVQPLTYCDYGVPWDLPEGSVEYVLTGYRDADRRTTEETLVWTDTSTNPGAAFGLATEDGLLAYVPGSESGELQVTWNPLYPIEYMQLAGVDYQIALRPAERRGLSVTINAIIEKFGLCTVIEESPGLYDESAPYDSDGTYDYAEGSVYVEAQGRYSMAPTPFQAVRKLERINRIQLKLPGGHVRFVHLDVGALVITPVRGIHMAEITLTDTVLPDVVPEGWAD